MFSPSCTICFFLETVHLEVVGLSLSCFTKKIYMTTCVGVYVLLSLHDCDAWISFDHPSSRLDLFFSLLQKHATPFLQWLGWFEGIFSSSPSANHPPLHRLLSLSPVDGDSTYHHPLTSFFDFPCLYSFKKKKVTEQKFNIVVYRGRQEGNQYWLSA